MEIRSTLSFSVDTLSEQLRTACLLECTAPKPGNVFPGKSFEDVTYDDFRTSAEVIAPILAESAIIGVGRAVRDAVLATKQAVGSNTNLGMILLLGPLAAVPAGQSCREGISAVLQGLDLLETELIYEAIRLAQPGGLGTAPSNDVTSVPEITIVEAMALAPHDRIAWQYVHHFDDVLNWGRVQFLNALHDGHNWEEALVRVHVQFIARQSDSLIFRKCGELEAIHARDLARHVIEQWPSGRPPPPELRSFDAWLREDGHRRNPGTTADLLAAMLFAVIRDGVWSPPATWELSYDGRAETAVHQA